MKPCDTCAAAIEGKCLSVLAEQPTVSEFQVDGLFVAQIAIAKAGTFTPQHSHCYDHLTFLARGSVRVYRDGVQSRTVIAPDAIVIPAGEKHLFETLTDDVLVLCIHNTSRTGAVEIAEEHQISGGRDANRA